MADNSQLDAGAGYRLGVVMPMANEEATVRDFLTRVVKALGPDDRVYCVLDNACKDRTRDIVEELSRTLDSRIVPVWAPQNRCVVDAYFRGYREAFNAPCRWILEMDAGLSHDPQAIPQFIAAMEAGFDFAGGSRFIQGGSHSGSLWRRLVSWGGTRLANLLVGTRMTDMTSGFECFSRPAMKCLLDRGVRSRAHFFQTEIRALMHQFRWVEVPIHYTNTSKALGASPITDALRSLWHLRKEARAACASGGRP